MNIESGEARLVLLCPAWPNGLSATAVIEVGTDHRLANPEPLAAMREACERAAATER